MRGEGILSPRVSLPPRPPLFREGTTRMSNCDCVDRGGRESSGPPAEAGRAALRRLFRSVGCGCPSGRTLHRIPQRIAARPPWSLSPPAIFLDAAGDVLTYPQPPGTAAVRSHFLHGLAYTSPIAGPGGPPLGSHRGRPVFTCRRAQAAGPAGKKKRPAGTAIPSRALIARRQVAACCPHCSTMLWKLQPPFFIQQRGQARRPVPSGPLMYNEGVRPPLC